MTHPKTLLPLTALALVALFGAGCDSEAKTGADYRVIAHVDLDALRASPSIGPALAAKAAVIDGDIGPCAAVFEKARSITVGVDEADAFEVYIEGPLDTDKANACADFVDAEVAKKAKAKGKKVEAVLLSGDIFAVFGGGASPSADRLDDLRDAAPSGARGKAAWVTAADDGDADPVEKVEAWLDAAKGVDAHVEVKLESEAIATEVYGQAALGLAALRMSDDMGDLAGAVTLAHGGDTLRADVHATPAQIRDLVAKSRARAGAHGKGETGKPSLHVSVGSE